jgi:hypothetical protein
MSFSIQTIKTKIQIKLYYLNLRSNKLFQPRKKTNILLI